MLKIQFILWITKSYLDVVFVFMRRLFSAVYLCMDDIAHIHFLWDNWQLTSPSHPYSPMQVSVFPRFPAVFPFLFVTFIHLPFLFLSSRSLLLYHLNSVIMQRPASFAVWNAARHSGNLLAGWLIPVYLAPVEPAVITEPSVMDAVGLGLYCCFAG